ncbi:MAG: orotate phosphoribosyltransferase [Gemmatimonadaceae bacterium]
MTDSTLDLTKRLVALLARHSLQRGTFRLSSGAESSHYIDARLTTMRPEGLYTIGQLALAHFAAANWRPDAVGGLTLGADPVSCAIAHASATSPPMLRAFTVRKEPKSHGTKRLIEGPLSPNDSVVIVEDTLTTGASALRAVQAAQEFGARVIGVLIVVDREEGGRKNIEQTGLDVRCLTKVSDILAGNS